MTFLNKITSLFYCSIPVVIIIVLFFFQISNTEMSKPVLSTHVLDTSTGTPGANIFVELFKQRDSDNWTQWHSAMTSGDGRVQFPFSKESMGAGTYKLKFNVGEYYEKLGKETIYHFVEIVFVTKEDQHYHIPLLLSPFGYTTYRGS